MFGHVTKRLTEAFNHYVDWSRVGELIGSGTHRYSMQELAPRAAILTVTVASGMIGAYLNNDEKTKCGTTTMALISGFVGFVVSHYIVIHPLIKKRREMEAECAKFAANIRTQIDALEPDMREHCRRAAEILIDHIYQLSLSNHTRSNASLTWGTRKRLLGNLQAKLTDEFDRNFWLGTPKAMMRQLGNDPAVANKPSLR